MAACLQEEIQTVAVPTSKPKRWEYKGETG